MLYENFVFSLSNPSHLHPSFEYGGLSAIKALFPTSDIGSGPKTFQPEALVQHISTAGRERYAPRYFIIGVESYMLCGKRHIIVEYCEYAPLFLFPFCLRLWSFIVDENV